MRRTLILTLIALPVAAQEAEEVLYRVEGEVRTDLGKPASGAIVTLWDALAADRMLADGQAADDGSFRLAVTRADAARRDHAFGPLRLVVHRTGYGRIERRLRPGDAPLRLKLGKAGEWVGIVRNERGDPLPGAPVIAQQGELRMATTTDEEGRYRFEDLTPSAMVITADADGYRPVQRIVPRPEETIFVLETRPLREGTVLDAKTKKPLVGVLITARGAGSTTMSDYDGKFALEVDQGSIALERDGYAARLIDSFGKEPIALAPAESVRGTVVDAEGEPVSFAEVELFGSGVRRRARTNAAGAFDFGVGVADFAFVVARRRGFLPGQATVDPGWRSDRVRVVLRKGAAVEGRVLREGEPVAGAEVIFSRRERPHGRAVVARAYSNLEGVVRVAALPPEAELVHARHDLLRSREVPVEAKLWLRLTARPPLEGIVRDERGKPVAGLKLAVEPGSNEPVRTDEKGAFSFEGLRTRPYRLVPVEARGFVRFVHPATPGQRVEITLERERGPHTLRIELPARRSGAARVELLGADWKRTRWVAATATVAEFPRVGAGTYRVGIATAGYLDASQEVVVTADQPIATRRIELARAGTLTLQATPGASIIVQTLAGEPAPRLSLKLPEGAAELNGFGPGRYRFFARARGELIVVREVEVGPKDPPRALDLRGGAAAKLSILVTDEARNPVEGAQVELVTPDGFSYAIKVSSDAQGRIEVRRLIRGPLTLVVKRGERRREQAVDIQPGTEQSVSVILP
ncbi:MAG: carboxypeptidase regulatory-like domain-containing protein [Planctomycetota bacterium]